jgi:hypothetical protein
MNDLVEYHRKSLVSFVVLICSSKPGFVKELLPQIPTSSLYQLHGDAATKFPSTVVERENKASPICLCVTTFNTKKDARNELLRNLSMSFAYKFV